MPTATQAWGLAWPVLVGSVLAIVAALRLRPWPIPAGDVLAPLSRVRDAASAFASKHQPGFGWLERDENHPVATERLTTALTSIERVGRSNAALLFAVVLFAMLFVALRFA